MRTAWILAALWLAQEAAAQQVVDSVEHDLDGDGQFETWDLIVFEPPYAELQVGIEPVASGLPIQYMNGRIAWAAPMATPPSFRTLPNGSIQIVSQNDAIGRGRWELALTVAHRDGRAVVAGWTYSWYDTLDPNNNGMCDANLLTGQGEMSLNGGPKKPLADVGREVALVDWNAEAFWPPAPCGG